MFAICSSCESSILCEVMMNKGLRLEPEIAAGFTYSLPRCLPIWCDLKGSCRVAYPEIHFNQSKMMSEMYQYSKNPHLFSIHFSSQTVNRGQKLHNSEGEKSNL